MNIKIYFDLDGTVYDLYNIPNWLERIENNDPSIFGVDGRELFNSDFVNSLLDLYSDFGVQFGVITWLPMQASPSYEMECEKVKREWVQQHFPFFDSFAAQSYGVPKQNAIVKFSDLDILIDDNVEICAMWENEKQGRKAYCTKNFNSLFEIINDIVYNYCKQEQEVKRKNS